MGSTILKGKYWNPANKTAHSERCIHAFHNGTSAKLIGFIFFLIRSFFIANTQRQIHSYIHAPTFYTTNNWKRNICAKLFPVQLI